MRKIKVLIVEDEEVTAKLLRKNIQSIGFEVTDLIDNADAALESIKRNKPDMVLMDIMLEGELDGFQCAKIISDKYDIPSLFLTGYSNEDLIDKIKNSEAFVFLKKPHTPEELHANIIITVTKHQINSQLKKTKHYYSTVLNSVGEGIVTCDLDAKVKFINIQALKFTRFRKEEVSGKNFDDIFDFQVIKNIFFVDSEETYSNNIKKKNRLLIADNWQGSKQNVFLSTDKDKHIPVSLTKNFIEDKKGNLVGFVVSFKNITESEKIEAELKKIQRIESLGYLASGIAHDFNNILTAILGNVSIAMLNSEKNTKVYDRLHEAEQAVYQAKNLTEQLLSFSESGAPIKALASIKKIVFDTSNFVVSGSNVTCEYDFSEDLFHTEIDSSQISQVISSIVLNAKQAMPDGGKIQIKAQNCRITENDSLPLLSGDYIKITISDAGIGIPDKFLPNIFFPLFTTKQQGSGLGLTNAFNIIKRHNGYITVESQLGKGSSFYIYLPAVKNLIIKKTKENTVEYVSQSGNVLIMDDEEEVRKVASNMFKSLGYNVCIAKNGEEAVEKVKLSLKNSLPGINGKFDYIILDLTIPCGLGGLKTVDLVLALDPDIKPIVCSGYSNDEALINYKKYGFIAALKKPYTISDIVKILNNK